MCKSCYFLADKEITLNNTFYDHDLHVENKNVGNNTRFLPASFLFNGQIIEHTTWNGLSRPFVNMYSFNYFLFD